MSLAAKLKKWTANQLISEAQANSILAFEKNNSRSRMYFGFGGIGVLSIILGIASIIASNWDLFSPETKIVGHTTLNLMLAGAILRFGKESGWLTEVLVTILAGLVMTFIALIGQILQTQAPLWQPLGYWLLFATPMLLFYARFKGVVAIWLGLLGVFVVSFASNVLSHEWSNVFIVAVPFLLYVLFGWKRVQGVLPYWASSVKSIFWAFLVIMTTVAQFFWGSALAHGMKEFAPLASVLTAGIGSLVVFGLNVAQRNSLIDVWGEEKVEMDAILLGSYLFASLPIIVPHGSLDVVGAVMFCLYWLLIGGVGLRLGIDKLWSLAVIMVGIRLFIAYIEILGSLAVQGIGFILTGGMFLFLAWATKKIMQSPPKWLLVSEEKGAQL